ncbi:hypothetical protein FUA23_15155 [Neolewinella aurantiaca]|uniref:Uncharacterized protein n=1 Tax=Neolewinella aurantiaca TaxID=2602767 RepID=A0A5C7FBQ5_9BACT|nr:hypothetical protein [Neolewinella aurantiaca]TXF88316.1 hypothetical protein FUA23_15155 [Neolewinella aurantiaca]
MRFFPRILVLLIFCCVSLSAVAQTNYEEAIGSFVDEHNARVSMRNWAKTETAPVSLRINDRNELEAFVDNESRLRITLQRDVATDMDELFPYNIDSALIIITNETVVIIDPVEKIHFALSLNQEPRLPEISAEPTLLFEGFGLTRNWAKM